MKTDQVEGWFAAHEGVDPLPELLKILRVAGSPYEFDSGYRWNNDETRAEGVLLINRYDWSRNYDMFPAPDFADIAEDDDSMADTNTVGLVDYAHGSSYVEEWAKQSPKERGSSPNGLWLYIPNPEYMWGRFGFDDEYTEARSFLFFTQRTDFYETIFPGQSQALRERETHVQWFYRKIKEGEDFSGIDSLRAKYTPPPPELRPQVWSAEQPPPESERLGPYNVDEHILSEQDIEALRASIPAISDSFKQYLLQHGNSIEHIESQNWRTEMGVFVDPWKTPTLDLLNELVMSYLDRFLLPLRSHGTPAELGPLWFPKHNDTVRDRMHMDGLLLKKFNEPLAKPIPGFDAPSVSARIERFLARRAEDQAVAFDKDCMAGVTGVVVFISKEILDIASSHAIGREDSMRDKDEKCVIIPHSIRVGVYYDEELLSMLRYSAVYWTGRP
ncbi:hypothetical protein ACJ41O_006613 [Fusarium nematophilum]